MKSIEGGTVRSPGECADLFFGRVEDLLITHAIGDNDRIATFIDVFIDQTNREGTLRVIDPTTVERSTERSRWIRR